MGEFSKNSMANSSFEFSDAGSQSANLKVIGIGGGGGNAVEYMLSESIEGVDFICLNTDAQALRHSNAPITMQLGEEITKGLGAGANPEIGKQAAYSDRERIQAILAGADMIFITAGMGGGTGTGAAPVVAEIAKEMGILTVAVVTKPFSFEGRKRALVADEGIKALSRTVDSLITIPNNRLLAVLGKHVSLLDAFKAANNVLFGAVQGIAELITRPGLINVDFADVRTVMAEMGMAMMGTGVAKGENRARLAAEAAIASPLLEDTNLSGARGVLVNITAGMDMSIGEFEEVGEAIKGITSEGATVVVGTVIDPDMHDELRVTIVATGLGRGDETEEEQFTINDSVRSDGSLDYQQLDRPALLRRQSTTSNHYTPPRTKHASMTAATSEAGHDVNYLDIPAFLRKKDTD